jgi:hypothetical protein
MIYCKVQVMIIPILREGTACGSNDKILPEMWMDRKTDRD